MRKVPTPLDRLKRLVDAIERGQFELVEYEAVAVKSDPGFYTVTALLERLVAERKSNNKRPPRQSKVRELIFDDDEDIS